MYGPVVRQPHGTYAVRYAGHDNVGIYEQLYRLNKAKSFEEWQAAMRKAGWKNKGHGTWNHSETGKKFYAWNVTQFRIDNYGSGQAWVPFAIEKRTPDKWTGG